MCMGLPFFVSKEFRNRGISVFSLIGYAELKVPWFLRTFLSLRNLGIEEFLLDAFSLFP